MPFKWGRFDLGQFWLTTSFHVLGKTGLHNWRISATYSNHALPKGAKLRSHRTFEDKNNDSSDGHQHFCSWHETWMIELTKWPILSNNIFCEQALVNLRQIYLFNKLQYLRLLLNITQNLHAKQLLCFINSSCQEQSTLLRMCKNKRWGKTYSLVRQS